jgi:biopolymer transport protein TolR
MRGMVGKIRHTHKSKALTALNLTSLIDLFTILVLFLLFNMSTEGDVIPDAQKIKLPESIAHAAPQATVMVMVTQDDILVDGVKVGSVKAIMDQEDMVVSGLKAELDKHAEKSKAVGAAMGTEVFGGKITILGDRELPFKLLEKVMFTCSEAEFADINLAVIQKET